MKACTLITSLLWCLSCRGFFLQNPVGHSEALLGNAGAALAASSANTLFNPAGLAFYKDAQPNFSVSGSVVSDDDSKSNLYQKSYNSLTSRTSLSGASFPLEYGIRMAPFYTFPQQSNFYGYNEATINGTRVRQAEEVTLSTAIGGLSYSGMIVPDTLSWGFSIGVLWNEQELQTSQLSDAAGGSSLTAVHEVGQYAYIALTPGLMWQVSENYSLGLVLTLNPLQLYSDGTTFSQGLSSGASSGTQNFSRNTPDVHGTTGITLGQGLKFADWNILFDLNYFDKEPVLQETAWQAALGVRKNLIPKLDLLTGVNYLRTADYSQYFLTGGIAVTYKSYEVTMGVYYKHTELWPADVSLQANSMAFLLSSTVEYSPF